MQVSWSTSVHHAMTSELLSMSTFYYIWKGWRCPTMRLQRDQYNWKKKGIRGKKWASSGWEADGLIRDNAEVSGEDKCSKWESPTVWYKKCRGSTWRNRLEGLPVNGPCFVFFIFPFWHPHLFKGVQRCQNRSANPCGVQPLLRSRDLNLYIFWCELLHFCK